MGMHGKCFRKEEIYLVTELKFQLERNSKGTLLRKDL